MNTDVELERRYRRLIALYPADFQAAYGEEMLATLAAGARTGQRRPALREVASIVRGAGWQQLRAVARHLGGSRWQEALAAGGALFAIVLTALYAQPVVVVLAWRVRVPDWVTRFGPGHTAIALAAGWCVVTICILGGLRRMAAIGAWLGVIGQAVHTGLTGAPSIVVTSWWRLILALTVAVALTPGMRRSVALPLRALRPALYGLVALLGLGAADVALAHVVATPEIRSVGLYGGNFIMPFTRRQPCGTPPACRVWLVRSPSSSAWPCPCSGCLVRCAAEWSCSACPRWRLRVWCVPRSAVTSAQAAGSRRRYRCTGCSGRRCSWFRCWRSGSPCCTCSAPRSCARTLDSAEPYAPRVSALDAYRPGTCHDRKVAPPRSDVALRAALVDRLVGEGAVRSPMVTAALRTVRRHVFIPEVPLTEAYADEALVIKRDSDGYAISSLSQPTMVAIMLEQLDVRPGHRVLEVGAGTGYNAALLAALVGDGGQVTTIEFDPAVSDRARSTLASEDPRVEVIEGDGEVGFTPGAPYDRIIVTVGAWDIPPAWWDQLRAGRAGGGAAAHRWAAAVGRVPADRLRAAGAASSIQSCAFVPMQGAGAFASADRPAGVNRSHCTSMMTYRSRTACSEALEFAPACGGPECTHEAGTCTATWSCGCSPRPRRLGRLGADTDQLVAPVPPFGHGHGGRRRLVRLPDPPARRSPCRVRRRGLRLIGRRTWPLAVTAEVQAFARPTAAGMRPRDRRAPGRPRPSRSRFRARWCKRHSRLEIEWLGSPGRAAGSALDGAFVGTADEVPLEDR